MSLLLLLTAHESDPSLLLTAADSDGRTTGRRGHIVLSCGRFVLHPALAVVVTLRIGRFAQLDGNAPRQNGSHIVQSLDGSVVLLGVVPLFHLAQLDSYKQQKK